MEYCAGIPCVNSGCKLCVCLPTVSGDGGGWTLCRGTGVGKRFTHTGEAGGGYEAWDGSDRSGERLLAGTTSISEVSERFQSIFHAPREPVMRCKECILDV